uniref:Actinodin1 n=1 Tax=Amphilophus citrinellus TaxID=61819 RepID=A0A3Q0R244_AMPCI
RLERISDFDLNNICFCFSLFVAFLSAGPVVQKPKGDAGESIHEKAAAAAAHRRLIRNRRNISWYKQHSDFWAWYKYFTDNGNQEAEMDRIFLAYLQNKNRAEGRRSYKAYLSHLGDIYKSCADSENPNCMASYMSRVNPKSEPPKPAPVKTCNPTKDPYCMYMALAQGKSPYMPLVLPAATPAPQYVRSAPPTKDPQLGYYYYSPSTMPFLTMEQKAELLRICPSDDVECLQYHLRAAYGYSAGPRPSYAHLGCDPKKDPTCKMTQKAPAGLYMQYPSCDPLRDPMCAYSASNMTSTPASPPATDLYAILRQYMAQTHTNDPYAPRMGAVPESNSNDPYSAMRDTAGAMQRHSPPSSRQQQQHPYSYPTYEEPAQEERHPLGPPGKTKEGYDCFIGYDRECYPVKASAPRSGVHRRIPYPAEAYEPHLKADGTRDGVLEPSNPHCDPEYDRDCRLRRYEPEQPQSQPERRTEQDYNQAAAEREQANQDQNEAEPYQSGQEESHTPYQPLSQGMPSLQDILRRYGDRYPEQDDHRAYADNYRKK